MHLQQEGVHSVELLQAAGLQDRRQGPGQAAAQAQLLQVRYRRRCPMCHKLCMLCDCGTETLFTRHSTS